MQKIQIEFIIVIDQHIAKYINKQHHLMMVDTDGNAKLGKGVRKQDETSNDGMHQSYPPFPQSPIPPLLDLAPKIWLTQVHGDPLQNRKLPEK